MSRGARRSLLSYLALAGFCAALLNIYGTCFVAPTAPRGAAPARHGGAGWPRIAWQSEGTSAAAALAGSAGGLLAVAGAAAAAARSARRARVAVQVVKGAPSLIQVLEQKKLLSLLEKLKLLSTAENAGVRVNTVEQLGLLKLAEERGLLTLAETIVTDPSTPPKLLAAAGALGVLTFADLTLFEGLGAARWFLAGALGMGAVLLGGAGLVIGALTAGTRQTKSLELQDKEKRYTTQGGDFGSFEEVSFSEDVTLLDVVERKKLLSFLEENRLLTLAGSLVNRPLTLTEQLGLLSTLESTGLLSTVESSATDYTALLVAVAATAIIGGAFVAAGTVGVLPAVLLSLPGLALFAVAIGLSIIKAPVKFVR